jgi:hypothetical protein
MTGLAAVLDREQRTEATWIELVAPLVGARSSIRLLSDMPDLDDDFGGADDACRTLRRSTLEIEVS